MLTIRHSSFDSTPDRPLPLAGYAARGGVFDSVDIPLRTSLLLIEAESGPAAFVASIDTLFVSDSLRRKICELESMQGLVVMLFASHTHNAPALAPELPLLGACDHDWLDEYVGRFDHAVRRLRAQAPTLSTVSFGEQSTRLNVNRRKRRWILDYGALRRRGRFIIERRTALCANPRGTIDPRVRLIAFADAAGDVNAVIWTFAAHAAFYPNTQSLSADFPGVVRNILARRLGTHCTSIYLPGFAGSAVPRLPVAWPRSAREAILRLLPLYPSLGRFSMASFHRWAEELAHAVDSAYDNRRKLEGLTSLQATQTSVRGIFRNRGHASKSDDIDLKLIHLALGDSCGILGCSGEMLGEWEPKVAPLFPRDTLLSGYLGGPCLYIPTSDELPQGGYEVTGFQPFFSLRGEFKPDITDAVVRQLQELVHA